MMIILSEKKKPIKETSANKWEEFIKILKDNLGKPLFVKIEISPESLNYEAVIIRDQIICKNIDAYSIILKGKNSDFIIPVKKITGFNLLSSGGILITSNKEISFTLYPGSNIFRNLF